MNYYEDLFQLCQDHLMAQLKRAKSKSDDTSNISKNLLLIPSFARTRSFLEFMPTCSIAIAEYECENLRELHEVLATIYVVEGSPLLRCMGMLFDYGVRRKENGVLLEVI